MSNGYISGGMTNIPEFNFPLFDSVARRWEAEGNVAFSPAENDRNVLLEHGIDDVTQVPGYAEGDVSRYNESIGDTKDLFRWDFNTITNECDSIVMIPGWELSTGARWERLVAEALGLRIVLALEHEAFGSVPDMWVFVDDDDQLRLTNHLKATFPDGGTPETITVPSLAIALTTRELIDELAARLKHVPGMSGRIEQISSALA